MTTLMQPVGCSCAEQIKRCGCSSSSSSLPQPTEKKPKLMSPTTTIHVEEENDDDDDDMNEEEARLYTKHLLESDGFDVPKFNKTFFCGYIIPYYNWKDDEIVMYNDFAKRALLDYNIKNITKLEFVKTLKVNAQGSRGIRYYITFEVMDAQDHSKIQNFQAKVFDGLTEAEFKVELCRPKPSLSVR